jgi:hypothetical protein
MAPVLSYELLDRIADSHNPLLGVIWLSLSAFPAFMRQCRISVFRFILGMAYLLVAYGFMWFDSATALWAKFGLDYSTHTAVAITMAAAIATISIRFGIVATVLVSFYIPLMIYQGYHTLSDIFSTAMAVCIPLFLMAYTIRKHPWAAANRGAGGFSPPATRLGFFEFL